MKNDKLDHQPDTPKVMVEYFSPSDELLNRYVDALCQVMTTRTGLDYQNGEIVNGFTEFLKLATRILVKHVNRQPEIAFDIMGH